MNAGIKGLLETFAVLFMPGCHASIIMLQIAYLNWGILNCLIIGLNLLPYLIFFFLWIKKRETNHLALLMAEPREWNVEKAFEDYMKLIEK